MAAHIEMVLTVITLLLGAGVTAPGGTEYKAGVAETTTAKPEDQKVESSARIASEIAQQLQYLSEHHQLPAVLQDVSSHLPYGQEVYDPYDQGYIKIHEENSAAAPDLVSPSGFNVKAVLGLVEYLILLILLKGSIGHIAERSRSRRDLRAPEEDLVGVAAKLRADPTLTLPGSSLSPSTLRGLRDDDRGGRRRNAHVARDNYRN